MSRRQGGESRHRILFYSHDTFGIGNIRRTLELSTAMSKRIPGLSILIITGSPIADAFPIPPNVDYVKLPALRRQARRRYGARATGFNTVAMKRMRAEICRSAVKHFAPNMMLVDKAPLGVVGELRPALDALKEYHPSCVRILALRDIIDRGKTVCGDWLRDGVGETISRQYDGLWVFGSPALFDVASEYQLAGPVVEKLRYFGWMGRNVAPQDPARVRRAYDLGHGPILLVTAGGGEDGDHLLTTCLGILDRIERIEPELKTVFVSGPLADPELRHLLAGSCQDRPRRRFLDFTPDLVSLVNAADGVISMGGYNTVCEILWLGKPALVVPRTHPVQEQHVRAERLAELNAIRMCLPKELTADRLVDEIRVLLHEFRPTKLDPLRFPFDGLERASIEAALILDGKQSSASRARTTGHKNDVTCDPHLVPRPM